MRGKRLVLLVLGICFMSLHVWADLPDRKLTLRLNDATMETFLNEVKKQTSINILYNAQMFEDTPTMDVEAQNEPWQKVLQRVLDKHLYNLGSCIFCGLCVAACPTGAIRFTNHFEHAVFTKERLLLQLNRPGSSQAAKPAPAPKPAPAAAAATTERAETKTA